MSPPTPMTPSPRSSTSRVLGTPELLAQILTHLDHRTLLVHAQRVSRTFHAVISDTPALQRRLFLPPPPTSNDDPPPLITDPDGSTRHLHRVHLNPLLVEAFPPFFPRGSHLPSWQGSRANFQLLAWAAAPAAFARPGASWRRMFLTDPSPTCARLQFRSGGAHSHEVTDVELAAAPRMGLLWDVVQELVVEKGRFASASFYPEWRYAEALTEEEWIQEQADWEERVVLLEGSEFVMEYHLDHFFGCIASVGPDLPSFRSEDQDVVDWKTLKESSRAETYAPESV